jgi:LPXTG-site transpeptidase (sortase) family protein
LDGELLSIGQEVKVPNGEATSTPESSVAPTPTPTSTPQPPATPFKVIAIEEGDTLSAISEEYDVSVDVLLQVNPELRPQMLQIGQEVKIPPAGATLIPSPTATPTITPLPGRPFTYVVQPGDSMLVVANRFGVTVDDIMAANPDTDPRRMAVGQELIIPDTDGTPEPAATSTPEARAINRIRIASLGVDAEVVEIEARTELQDGVEVLVWEEADNAASFHKGSSYPGEGGNVVISGRHRGQGEVFRDLADVTEGATVSLHAGEEIFEYVVEQILIVPQEYISAEKRRENEKWLEDTGEERLTLISYWPYDKSTHRIIVVSKPEMS